MFLLIFLSSYSGYAFEYEFVPFQGRVFEIETEHFIILFAEKHTDIARTTAGYAEDIHTFLSADLQWHPAGKTTIVLTDHLDYANGSANPFTRNVIYLYLTPADTEETLRYSSDTYYSLILHEYTHILHLDQVRGAAIFWTILYGKLYHPVVNSFRWYIEGVATEAESSIGIGGRVDSPYDFAMVNRAAVSRNIPSFDQLVYPVKDWPGNRGTYHFGARFLRYLRANYSEEQYDKIFIELSDDFFPFITSFVANFQNIYGKSLTELWNEWREYEYANAVDSNYTDRIILQTDGVINDIEIDGDTIYYSLTALSGENLWRLNNGRSVKLVHGYINSIESVSGTGMIYYTKMVDYPGGFSYFDLFSYNTQTSIETQLTFMERIRDIAVTTDGVIYFTTVSDQKSRLFSANIDNYSITDRFEINLPDDTVYINDISISDNNDKLIVALKNQNGNNLLWVYSRESGGFSIIERIQSCRTAVVSGNKILFTALSDRTEALFVYDMDTSDIFLAAATDGIIKKGDFFENGLCFIDYRSNGEAIVHRDILLSESYPIAERYNPIDLTADLSTYRIAPVNYLRYMLPRVWGIVPYILNTEFYIDTGSAFINIPIVAPALYIENSTPLGRFHYDLTIAFDYMKMYPENTLNFRFNLPSTRISFGWSNWAGGRRIIINDKNYEYKVEGRYPIEFSHYFGLDFYTPILTYGYFYAGFTVTHSFAEYNWSRMAYYKNSIFFVEYLAFENVRSINGSNRWNQGISVQIIAFQYPPILDNNTLYGFRSDIRFKLPIGKGAFFSEFSGGVELQGTGVFSAGNDIISILGAGIGGAGKNSLFRNNMKGFVQEITNISYGSAFGGVDAGIEIVVYDKTKYLYFASLVFKEFYIKTFTEFVYIYNKSINPLYGLMVDQALELTLDFFVDYGNIEAGATLGGSVGYRVGDKQPAWSVYGLFKVSY